MTAPTDVAEQTPTRARRRWWAIGAAAVAVLALLAGGITLLVLRSGTPTGTRLEVSDIESLPGKLPGGIVQLPSGRMAVAATAPLRELPDFVPADQRSWDDPGRVGGFGRWVGVEWTVGVPSDPDRLFDPARRQPKQFQVALVADGERHDLAAAETGDPNPPRPAGYLAHKALYVALPGDPATLTLEVGYDGVTQSLDLRTGKVDAGAAAPLYARTRWTATSAPCAGDTLAIAAPGFAADRDDVQVQCMLADVAVAAPYLPGKGWAKPGRTWVTLLLRTEAPLAFVRWPSLDAADPTLYRLTLRSSELTAAGAPPAVTTSYYQQGLPEQAKRGLLGAYFSFDVPAGAPATVTVTQTYAGRTAAPGPGAPAEARGTVRFPIELRP